jgi:hypothetical protein
MHIKKQWFLFRTHRIVQLSKEHPNWSLEQIRDHLRKEWHGTMAPREALAIAAREQRQRQLRAFNVLSILKDVPVDI